MFNLSSQGKKKSKNHTKNTHNSQIIHLKNRTVNKKFRLSRRLHSECLTNGDESDLYFCDLTTHPCSLLRAALCQWPCEMRYWSSQIVHKKSRGLYSPLFPKRKKGSLGLFLSSSIDKILVEGKREHPRRSIKLLSDCRAQRFEKGRMWAQSLKATMSRKESKAKHSRTRIPEHALGREPAVHKQLWSHRGVSCCC